MCEKQYAGSCTQQIQSKCPPLGHQAPAVCQALLGPSLVPRPLSRVQQPIGEERAARERATWDELWEKEKPSRGGVDRNREQGRQAAAALGGDCRGPFRLPSQSTAGRGSSSRRFLTALEATRPGLGCHVLGCWPGSSS